MSGIFRDIAVIGSGLMGSGIAQVFASRGYPVTIQAFEDTEEAVRNKIRSNMRLLMEHGIGDERLMEETLGRIRVTADLEEAVRGKDFVVEAVFENMELKQNVFADLDRLCRRDAVLATNTSVMSITEIASKARYRDRIVGTHFWNPPYLIPLVEVTRAEHTSEETMDKTIRFLQEAGKHPVRVNKDVPGFVANRLQHALWREAISIVERGIADAKTVDECIRYTLGLRLGVLAPLENSDMIGNDLTLSIHEYILKHIENATEPSPLLKEKVARGELGFKSGKGFYDWTPEETEASRRRLIAHLAKAVAELGFVTQTKS